MLFDVLKCHGGSFAESFWSRIFERVLLPIFDHVRAEVTDTTTFTSERRRQQEDAWLYETCTHCLQVRRMCLAMGVARVGEYRDGLMCVDLLGHVYSPLQQQLPLIMKQSLPD